MQNLSNTKESMALKSANSSDTDKQTILTSRVFYIWNSIPVPPYVSLSPTLLPVVSYFLAEDLG